VLTERECRDDFVRNRKKHFENIFWIADKDVLNIPQNMCLTSGCYFSKIPLDPFPPERRSADLSDILDYETVHTFS